MNILVFFLIGTVGASWLLPNHYYPWVSAYQDFAAFGASLLSMAGLLIVAFVHKKNIVYPRISLFVVGLGAIPLLQYNAGIIFFGGDALISSLFVLGFFIMLVAGYNLALIDDLSPSFTVWLAGILIFAAVISTGLALYQWTFQPISIWIADLPPNARPFANLAQPNQLATLLGMGLAATLYFYEKRNINRISSSLIAVVLLFGLALTQSRTPWLMAIFFVVLWLWKFDITDRRLPRMWALIWVAVFISLILVLPHLAEFLQLSDVTPAIKRAAASSRWPMYTQFVHAIVEGPLWGYGWQQGSAAQLAITPFYTKLEYTEYTHNILLDLLVWNGPVLGGIIIAAVTCYLLRLAFLARSTESVFVVMAVGFFLLHSLLEYPHAYAYFLLPIGLLIGILQSDIPCRTWRISRWFAMFFLIGSAGLYAVIWHEYRLIEEDYRLMRFEKNRVGTLKADKPAPDVQLLTQLQALTRHSRLPAKANMTAEEMNDLYRYSRRFAHPASLFKYAQALALNGELKESYQQLALLRRIHGDRALRIAIFALEKSAENHPNIEPLLQRLYAIKLKKPVSSSGLTAPAQTKI